MNLGRSYKQHPIEGEFDAIVIGSGIGGLTAAALLARFADKRVLVLERHYTAGGFTHTFQRPGYEWDVGVHYIGQTQPGTLLRRAFDAVSDGSLEWADMGSVYDTIVFGSDRYQLVAGRENFRQRMREYFPDEGRAIDEYLARITKAARATQMYFAEKVLPGPVAATLGSLMRYSAMRHGGRTTLEVLRSLTDNARLIGVLTGQYGDYGLPPAQSSFMMHAMVVNHYLGGAAYPVGGSRRIAESILPVIEAAGGAVFTSAEVTEILVESGRAVGVRLLDGNEVRARQVVSDAGVDNTFRRLLPVEVAERHGLIKRLTRTESSVSHVSLYLGFREPASALGLTKSNVWVYPGYDHDANVARYLADPEAPLPVAYLSFPSAKDPDFERRFPGRATVEVVGLAPYEWFARWQDAPWKRRGAEYEALKHKLSERLEAALLAEHPQLAGKVDVAELSTPLSTRHFTGFVRGEIYGLSHTPSRFAQKWLRPRTPIPGLFLTGADVCSAGVGGALFGGVLASCVLLGRNMLATIARQPRARSSRHAA